MELPCFSKVSYCFLGFLMLLTEDFCPLRKRYDGNLEVQKQIDLLAYKTYINEKDLNPVISQ